MRPRSIPYGRRLGIPAANRLPSPQRLYDACMDVPAVWTINPEADREEVEDVLARLGERLGIPTPEIRGDSALLPPNYPQVAEALDEVEPSWRDEELFTPPEP
jgi:hypothetical protein